MPGEVRVPPLGESVAEATIGAWLKKEGELVQAGEPLVELETEKVNVDVAADRTGVLQKIERQAGDTVRPGEVIAVLADGVEVAQSGPAPPVAGPNDDGPGYGGTTTSAGGEAGVTAPASSEAAEQATERPHSSPLASRLAEEHGIDLAQVPGTGTAGRVTREDVERYLGQHPSGSTPSQVPLPASPVSDAASPAGPAPAAPAPSALRMPTPAPAASVAAPPADPRGEERVRMSRRRLTIARRLLEAQQTAAMLTTFNEVDLTHVIDVRKRQRDTFKERHGVNLGFMSFFARAVVGALKVFPRLNAEIQGEEMVLKRYYDIGVAVGAQDGLVVPIVRDADRKSFAQIEQEIRALSEKAQNNSLTLEDLRGGTFTITNGGVFGSLNSTPILSPPQVGILGMHAIQERPVARDGQVVVRPMMYLALTYDHRIVDGREAVQFLVRVKELLEDSETMLLES